VVLVQLTHAGGGAHYPQLLTEYQPTII